MASYQKKNLAVYTKCRRCSKTLEEGHHANGYCERCFFLITWGAFHPLPYSCPGGARTIGAGKRLVDRESRYS